MLTIPKVSKISTNPSRRTRSLMGRSRGPCRSPEKIGSSLTLPLSCELGAKRLTTQLSSPKSALSLPKGGFIFPSAALTIRPGQVKHCRFFDKPPEVGDAVYGTISRIGQHSSIENASGRIHMIQDGSKGIFVFGNRYAPDYYEGIVPERMKDKVDLLSRSGIVGIVKTKNSLIKDPTKVKVLGYVCNDYGGTLNTRDFPLIKPRNTTKNTPELV